MNRVKFSLLWINEHRSGIITIRVQILGSYYFYDVLYRNIYHALRMYNRIMAKGDINLIYWNPIDEWNIKHEENEYFNRHGKDRISKKDKIR